MRDFGKFWEVLGRGSGETLQTTHGIDPEAAHKIKLSKSLKISQKFPPVPPPIDCTPLWVYNTRGTPEGKTGVFPSRPPFSSPARELK